MLHPTQMLTTAKGLLGMRRLPEVPGVIKAGADSAVNCAYAGNRSPGCHQRRPMGSPGPC